jgi:hypothetical protein
MQRMFAVLAANPAADGAGLVATVCFIAWPLFQARWMMLIAYIGNNLCFALHYALLGDWTAVAICSPNAGSWFRTRRSGGG